MSRPMAAYFAALLAILGVIVWFVVPTDSTRPLWVGGAVGLVAARIYLQVWITRNRVRSKAQRVAALSPADAADVAARMKSDDDALVRLVGCFAVECCLVPMLVGIVAGAVWLIYRH